MPPQAQSAPAAPAGLPHGRPPVRRLRAGHGGDPRSGPATAAPGPRRPGRPARTTFPGSAGRGPAGPGWGCWEGRCLACWLSGASGREGLLGVFFIVGASRKGKAPQPKKSIAASSVRSGTGNGSARQWGRREAGSSRFPGGSTEEAVPSSGGLWHLEVGFGNHFFNLWFL